MIVETYANNIITNKELLSKLTRNIPVLLSRMAFKNKKTYRVLGFTIKSELGEVVDRMLHVSLPPSFDISGLIPRFNFKRDVENFKLNSSLRRLIKNTSWIPSDKLKMYEMDGDELEDDIISYLRELNKSKNEVIFQEFVNSIPKAPETNSLDNNHTKKPWVLRSKGLETRSFEYYESLVKSQSVIISKSDLICDVSEFEETKSNEYVFPDKFTINHNDILTIDPFLIRLVEPRLIKLMRKGIIRPNTSVNFKWFRDNYIDDFNKDKIVTKFKNSKVNKSIYIIDVKPRKVKTRSGRLVTKTYLIDVDIPKQSQGVDELNCYLESSPETDNLPVFDQDGEPVDSDDY
jgi:hypothetical protein